MISGTPQKRWREMHQSGRSAIMSWMRSLAPGRRPLDLGNLRQGALGAAAAPLAAGTVARPSSSCTNHCSVARKITGLWQRQQCG